MSEWRVVTKWQPLPHDGWQSDPTTTYEETEEKARRRGLQHTCFNGSTSVTVLDPRGRTRYSWVVEDNYWREHEVSE